MSEPNDGGFAFPWAVELRAGLTKREYFAGQALMGMCASPPMMDRSPDSVDHAAWAKNAYLFADAMLSARSPVGETES